jgi:predicted phosphodiesterase
MNGMTWLHLSDWHQKGKEFGRTKVRDALVKDIEERRTRISTDLAKIDFVMFSGDAAWSGTSEEYEAAIEHFFAPVLAAASLGRDRLFIVPGNHDLDRTALSRAPANLLESCDTSERISELLTDGLTRNKILSPMDHYQSFVRDFLAEDAPTPEPAYGFTTQFQVNGQSVGIVGLNSAWLCGRHKEVRNGIEDVNDYGYLVLGEAQVHDALYKTSRADIRIAVMHHPFDWFATTDKLAEKGIVRGRLIKGCHFVLHGHEHESNVSVARGMLGDCVVIGAGSCYDRLEPIASRYANGYNYVHVDFRTSLGTAYLRRYEDRQGWIADTATTGDAMQGRCEFPLPKQREASATGPNPPTTLSPSGFKWRATLASALLECRSMRDRHSRDAIVDELRYPLRSTISRNSADQTDVMNILTRCLDYQDGLIELIEIVRFYEGDSTAMDTVDGFVRSAIADAP